MREQTGEIRRKNDFAPSKHPGFLMSSGIYSL